MRIIEGNDIDSRLWSKLVKQSSVATWFQTQEAYAFFDSLSFLEAFAYAVESDGVLKGVVVGYIQKDGGKLKQFFSRRAIILGGPLLADDISNEELDTLLAALKSKLRRKSIYIETRNFNDYGRWRSVFENCRFEYVPHLDFHLKCTNLEDVESRIGKHRRRYIRLSMKNGAKIIEYPTIENVRDFYSVLDELYKTKVKSSLFPICFFEELFRLASCKYVLIEYEGSIVGGSVCVMLKNKAVYEWFACGKDGVHRNIHPSSLTKYAGICYALDNGYKIFDMMGAGKPDEDYGVRDFKAEFGGDLVEFGRFVHISNTLLYKVGCLGVKLLKKL